MGRTSPYSLSDPWGRRTRTKKGGTSGDFRAFRAFHQSVGQKVWDDVHPWDMLDMLGRWSTILLWLKCVFSLFFCFQQIAVGVRCSTILFWHTQYISIVNYTWGWSNIAIMCVRGSKLALWQHQWKTPLRFFLSDSHLRSCWHSSTTFKTCRQRLWFDKPHFPSTVIVHVSSLNHDGMLVRDCDRANFSTQIARICWRLRFAGTVRISPPTGALKFLTQHGEKHLIQKALVKAVWFVVVDITVAGEQQVYIFHSKCIFNLPLN